MGNKWQKRRRHNEGERSGQAEFDQPRDPGRGSRDVLECQWEGRDVHAGEVGGMEGGVGVNVCLKMGLLAPECLLESPDTYDIVPPYVFWRACWHMPPPPLGVGLPPPPHHPPALTSGPAAFRRPRAGDGDEAGVLGDGEAVEGCGDEDANGEARWRWEGWC